MCYVSAQPLGLLLTNPQAHGAVLRGTSMKLFVIQDGRTMISSTGGEIGFLTLALGGQEVN